MTLLRHLLAGILSLFLSCLATGTLNSFGAGTAFAQSFADNPTINVEIGGNQFTIPRPYLMDSEGLTPAWVLLSVLMPSMDPMREDNKGEFVYAHGFGRTVSILIRDARQTAAIELRLAAHKAAGAPYERHEDRNGLVVYAPKDFSITRDRTARREIYVDDSGGRLHGYIACDVEGSVPFPGCEHEFTYDNLLLRVSYGKSHLPEWRTIEESVKRLLDRFAQQSAWLTLDKSREA